MEEDSSSFIEQEVALNHVHLHFFSMSPGEDQDIVLTSTSVQYMHCTVMGKCHGIGPSRQTVDDRVQEDETKQKKSFSLLQNLGRHDASVQISSRQIATSFARVKEPLLHGKLNLSNDE